MAYRLLTTLIVGLHFAWLAYIAAGGFLAWRWPWAVWPHLGAVSWGVALVVAGLDCPLTAAEDWSRQRAGEPPLTAGFVDRYLEGVIYPERYTGLVQALVAILVAVSWAGVYVRWRRARAMATAREVIASRTAGWQVLDSNQRRRSPTDCSDAVYAAGIDLEQDRDTATSPPGDLGSGKCC
jgi:hypothetical protein